MFRDEIISKIEGFRELGIPEIFKRKVPLNQVNLMVSTVIGARRAGKSFRVLQAAQEALEQKNIASIDHILHLDFDNPILAFMSSTELSSIPEIFLSITPGSTLKTPLLFIFDEIHVVNGWERFVIDLSRNRYWKVIVTGSSSKLLHHDIATELRGKAVPTTVYPLSFREFLVFKAVPERFSKTGSAHVRAAFNEFLTWGSFPVIPVSKEPMREVLLREYFNTMMLKDVIERHNISNPRKCILLFHYLLSCIGKPVTIHSAHAFMKTSQEQVNREMIAEWVNFAQDAFMFFTVPVYSDSLRTQERNYKKLYAIDWALAHVNGKTWDSSLSRSLENVVYMHLVKAFARVNYYMTRDKRREVDFIAVDNRGKVSCLVQVCLDISDAATLQKELSPLVDTARYFGVKDNFIVTLDQTKILEIEGVKVLVRPAWKWLLEYTADL